MRLLIATTASLITSSAIAHEGPHMHPHGGESILTMMVVAMIAAGATWAIARRR